MHSVHLIRAGRLALPSVAALLLAGCANFPSAPGAASEPVTLRVNVFRGSSNIPIYMAMERFFAR